MHRRRNHQRGDKQSQGARVVAPPSPSLSVSLSPPPSLLLPLSPSHLLPHQAPQQLHHLNKHPVIRAPRKELEETGSHEEVVLGILVGELGYYVDGAGDDGGVGVG